MTSPRTRTRDSLGPMAVMLAVAAAILFPYGRLAHAGTDPTVAITSGVDTSISVWTTDGPLWLAVAGGYVALRTFLSRQHWLSQGRVLAVLTGLAGVGAAVIGWHFQGAPSTGILTALLAAIALVQHPTVPPAPARDPQAGRARLAALVAIALIGAAVAGAAMISCTKAQVATIPTNAEHALVNCTAQAIGTTPRLDDATLVAVILAAADEKAKCTPDGGSLNWDCVERDLVAEGKVLGGCTLVALLTGSPTPPPASTPGVAARMAAENPGLAVLERFRAKVAGGATFHTAAGDY